MSVHGYGEAMFSDSNSRRPNGTTDYNGSLFLSGLWKEQVLDKKGVSYVHGPFYSTSYAACSELLVPSGPNLIKFNPNNNTDFNLISESVSKQNNSDMISKIEIISMQGVVLQSSNVKKNLIDFDFSNYPKGYYLFKVYSAKNIFTKKIIISE